MSSSANRQARHSGGFTLLELLVAMAIFTFLGGTLAYFLHQGLRTWREGETLRTTYEEAHQVLALITEDLTSLFSSPRPARPGSGTPARLWLVPDQDGRQRLYLVRTIRGESEDPVLGRAGDQLLPSGTYDLRDDHEEVLRPGGGLMEVAWLFDPEGKRGLYRAARVPPGGVDGLADWFLAPTTNDQVRERAIPVSEQVLHFEIRLWGPWTTTWDPAVEPLPDADPSGPVFGWDSTRSELPFTVSRSDRHWDTSLRGARSGEAGDDLFPTKAMVLIVVEEAGPGAFTTLTAQPFGPGDRRIVLRDTAGLPTPDDGWPYLLVGREWIRYARIEGNAVIVEQGGRGVRGTAAVEHPANQVVRPGRTFVKVIRIPAARDHWE